MVDDLLLSFKRMLYLRALLSVFPDIIMCFSVGPTDYSVNVRVYAFDIL